jgi:ribonucleoside-diphosphate reductase beta chain
MTVLNTKTDIGIQPAFYGRGNGLMRFDKLRYPFFLDLTKKQRGFFWQPEEVDLTRDSKDFKLLSDAEKHIFTSNLKRQILLDSVQGRGPSEILAPIASLPEIELWIRAWSFFEDIHAYSYQYILENVYPDTSAVYDNILELEPIVNCARSISEGYNNLEIANFPAEGASYGTKWQKQQLWVALNAINILEGIRFYVSFACSWAFAETKRMEGNAKIIKLICRDENLHLAATQNLLKILPKEDEVFAALAKDQQDPIEELFVEAVNQEKAWAKFLFEGGSMVGLNEELLCQYIEWIANKRMTAIGIKSPYSGGSNPLPWTQKWISGQDIQVAPQETQITSYTIGEIAQDVKEDSFTGFTL